MATHESVRSAEQEILRLTTCPRCGERVTEDHRFLVDSKDRRWHRSCARAALGKVSGDTHPLESVVGSFSGPAWEELQESLGREEKRDGREVQA